VKVVFADTFYWIAIADPQDSWHTIANKVSESLGKVILLTTDEVLIEFLTALRKEKFLREVAVKMVKQILAHPNIRVIPQSRDSFYKGLKFYAKRLDKTYSMVDCISMKTMQEKSISEILTNDNHFEQAGFQVLIKQRTSGKLL
jgi:predicted nucleic acid-binding protein